MAGGQDNTACCFLTSDRQLGGRRGCQAYIDHIIAHAHQRAADERFYHMPAQTGITANHNLVIAGQGCTALRSIGCCETNYIYRIQPVSYAPTYRAADS